MSLNLQKSDIKKAIKGSGGIISSIAKKLNCDWHTANRYIKLHDLSQEVKNEKETLIDMAEGALMRNIQDGDNTAIIFYLKTQGKDRGYVERQELKHDVKGVSSSEVMEALKRKHSQ